MNLSCVILFFWLASCQTQKKDLLNSHLLPLSRLSARVANVWCSYEGPYHFSSIRVRDRMLIFAIDLTNCSNMPSAAKPNWLLSPSIELRAGSSFSLLLLSSAFCQSLNLILPHTHAHAHARAQTHTGNAIRKWLTREWEWVWALMMARGGTGWLTVSAWESLWCVWGPQGWYYRTNGFTAPQLLCFSENLCRLLHSVRSKMEENGVKFLMQLSPNWCFFSASVNYMFANSISINRQ